MKKSEKTLDKLLKKCYNKNMAGEKTGFTACIKISGIYIKEEKIMSTFFGESTRESAKVAKVKLFSAWKTLDASMFCVIGFEFCGNIYLKVTTHEELAPFVGITREQANNDNFRIRLVFNKKQKEELIAKSAILCDTEEFENIMIRLECNHGEAFEYAVKRYLKLNTEKDNSAWFNGSDMEYNGISYSIKFEKGTICSEQHFINNGFTASDFETL